jgi:hypothetical protein
MKKKFSIIAAATLFLTIGCTKILEETPRSKFDPDFFTTKIGVQGGIDGLYTTLRELFGQQYYYNACETGTDEYTLGAQADGNHKSADLAGAATFDASTSRFDVLWNVAYRAINTANGVIENGDAAGISAAAVAEARFFRGFYYFLLAQSFGGVPLDLGAGELKFNNFNPTLFSTRNTVPEVYSKSIFPDLEQAVENLPNNPRITGAVTKNVARLALSRAYLTFGWWLENPKGIKTYPECTRAGVGSYAGLTAAQYFQKAYDVATYAIDNPGPYKLQETYYDVHVATNDRNSEIMLWADHTENSAKYNEGNVTGWDGDPYTNPDYSPQNQAVWAVTWYFQEVKTSSTNNKWTDAVPFIRNVQAGQSFSRMWSTMAPTIDALTKTFTEKDKDSRFDGTFVRVYRGTWDLVGGSGKDVTYYNANYLPIRPGDSVVTFLDEDPDGNIINYKNDVYKSNRDLGYMPGVASWVVPLSKISGRAYPGLWKLGAYRKNKTDYNDDKVASTRPFNILKFSEFYFIAAEAAVKGATTVSGKSATELVNVIRARAGQWKFNNAKNAEEEADYGTTLTAATPNLESVTEDEAINFILAERSREYFGEGYRWHDLARTQKWAEIAGEYTVCDKVGGEQRIQKRIFKDLGDGPANYLYLRPIPTGQLDNMDGDKVSYQNPGY